MNGKVHMALGTYVGITSGILLSTGATNIQTSGPEVGACLIIGTMIGSLLPDIDIPNSIIGRKLYLASVIINACAGHRGFFHSPFGLSVIMFFLYRLNPTELPLFFLHGLTIGCGIHLIQDMLTTGGIPLFFPFSKKRVGPRLFKSNSARSVYASIIMGIIWTGFIYLEIIYTIL